MAILSGEREKRKGGCRNWRRRPSGSVKARGGSRAGSEGAFFACMALAAGGRLRRMGTQQHTRFSFHPSEAIPRRGTKGCGIAELFHTFFSDYPVIEK
jgi:hypothetical protein